MNEERAKQLLAEIGPIEKLPSMPDVVLEALEILESDSADSERLGEVISRDPGLASQVLRIANSAANAAAGGPVDSLPAAIMRLGFEEVSNLCVTAGTMAALADHPSAELHDFWSHSATTAIATGELARMATCVENDRRGRSAVGSPYYLAGLLHDIGVLICRGADFPRYREVTEKNAIAREPLYVTESALLGFHHGELGAALACVWGLPDIVVAAAEYHHEPERAPEGFRRAVEIVHVADWMTHHMGIGDAGDGVIERFRDQAWISLGLDIEQFPELISSLTEASLAAQVVVRRDD